jgi:hypothetical protein
MASEDRTLQASVVTIQYLDAAQGVKQLVQLSRSHVEILHDSIRSLRGGASLTAVYHAAEQAQKPAGGLEDEEQVPPSNAAETGKSDDEEERLEAGAAAVAQVDARESVSFLSERCIKTETKNETD